MQKEKLTNKILAPDSTQTVLHDIAERAAFLLIILIVKKVKAVIFTKAFVMPYPDEAFSILK